MKRTIKIVALCLCLMALGAAFTGCDYVEDMRNSHAVISDDMQTITFRGETYKRLPDDCNIYCSYFYHYDYQNAIHTTIKEVPTLLKHIKAFDTGYDEIRDILNVLLDDKTSSVSENKDIFFCNEKDYDKYIKAINENVKDRIGFEYEVYSAYGDDGWRYVLEVLSEETSKEILSYMENPEKLSTTVYKEKINFDYREEIMGFIYLCDKDGIIAEELSDYGICRVGNVNTYLVDWKKCVAVELSAEANKEINQNKFFYGDNSEIDTASTAKINPDNAEGETVYFFD